MQTLIDSLQHQAQVRPRAVAFRFLGDGERETDSLDYGALDHDARRIAHRLRELNAQGQRVLLLLPQDLRFIIGFFGCLYADAVAVPLLTPGPRRSLSTLRAIAGNAKPSVALTTRDVRARLEPELAFDCPGLIWQCVEDVGDVAFDGSALSGSEGIAFLQYTSGSTGTPKGVMVSHINLLHNIEAIGQAFAVSSATVAGGWLPMYHDMGLIGLVLTPVYYGLPSVLMPAPAFLQRPARWLKMISQYRISASGGPNFAYDLCVDKVDRNQALDLSSWEVAFNGSEPVRWSTIERFCRAFEHHGFRARAMFPCYGMAESTLFITGDANGTAAGSDVDSEALRAGKVQAPTADRPSIRLVACGKSWHGTRVEVVDPVTRSPLGEREIGEIWIAGGSVAAGYFDAPEATADVFGARLARTGEGPFLRTGDLGFRSDGALYIAGRLKDVIIIRGRNYYPHDLETTAEQANEALQKGAGAAFCIDADDREELIMVHELKRTSIGTDYRVVSLDIREAVSAEHGVGVHSIALIKPGTLPKTSSGKVRRSTCRDLFLRDELHVLYRFANARPALESRPSRVE